MNTWTYSPLTLVERLVMTERQLRLIFRSNIKFTVTFNTKRLTLSLNFSRIRFKYISDVSAVTSSHAYFIHFAMCSWQHVAQRGIQFDKHLLFLSTFAYIKHAQARTLSQLVLSNVGKVACSRKQREPLMGFEHTTGHYESCALNIAPRIVCLGYSC